MLTQKMIMALSSLLLLALITSGCIYAIPAAWVAQQVATASGSHVTLAHARGLWHHGSAVLALSSGAGGADAAHWTQRVSWEVTSLKWPSLWTLRLTWPEVGPPLSVTLRAGLAGWSTDIAPWRGIIPLAALAGFGAPFNTLALEGDAQIRLSHIRLTSAPEAQPPAVSNVEINIVRLRSALAQGVVLGNYVVHGKAGSGGATFELRTTQGELLLDGSGHCLGKIRLSCGFAGTARAARHDDAILGNLLGLLGKPQAQVSGKTPVTELRW